ncbi:hypothetical protein [Pseudomonas sp. 6D_7.1_Bac1]|jgi:hypothetical protein|uniref:hypothetical protein n=1 Tax=Pseudomonas sp. 6D_7.1_Bac1 TaxID=2971615 RepID=UPI0021C8024F|nr:hypothetical protein [Pseudomonas sp. 6D_7.1_Bac1]MCU1750596.1 hypothetical protein [Pseudomonas sp. 6D_7.1_Bac1]
MYRRVLLGALLGLSLSACYYYVDPGYYGPAVYATPAPYYYGGYYGGYYAPYYCCGFYYGPRYYYGGYRGYHYGGYGGRYHGGGGYHGHH